MSVHDDSVDHSDTSKFAKKNVNEQELIRTSNEFSKTEFAKTDDWKAYEVYSASVENPSHASDDLSPNDIQLYLKELKSGVKHSLLGVDYTKVDMPTLNTAAAKRFSAPVCRLTAEVGHQKPHVLDICVDSGATMSLISARAFNKIKHMDCVAPLKKTDHHLTGAGGASLNILGVTCIQMNIQRTVIQCAMFVGDLTGVDCLLGMDWLVRANAIIDLGRMELTLFAKCTLKLRDTHFKRPQAMAIMMNQESNKGISDSEDAMPAFASAYGEQIVRSGTCGRIKCVLLGAWEKGSDAYFTPGPYQFDDKRVDIIDSLERPKKVGDLYVMHVAVSNSSMEDLIVSDRFLLGYAKPLTMPVVGVRKPKRRNAKARIKSSRVLANSVHGSFIDPESHWTEKELQETQERMNQHLKDYQRSFDKAEKPYEEQTKGTGHPRADSHGVFSAEHNETLSKENKMKENPSKSTRGSRNAGNALPRPSPDPNVPERSKGTSKMEVEEWAEIPKHLRTMLPPRGNMTDRQAELVVALVTEFQDIFVGPDGTLGWTDKIQHEIKLEDQSEPFKSRVRPLSVPDKEFVRETISDLLRNGKIRPSKSPWGAPPVLVRKKDGSQRFCVDFRKLNDLTKKDAYPIPRIEEMLDCLNGSKFFCTLDFASGYWQIAMHPDDVEKTAFITHCGLFEWIIMPFGLCNAPATFCRLMENVMSDIVWQKCLVYLDDVITFGRTFEETLENLRAVFVRVRKNNLKLKASKCHLLQRKVEYLGHEVSGNGIRPSPAKVVSLHDMALPQTLKEVRSFIGICSYYRRFIPHFSELAEPLIALTRKNVVCNTNTDECKGAFESLKRSLINAPQLHYIDPKLPFILDTDASDCAIGACLAQEYTDSDGNVYERPVAFASKTLNDSRRRYCTTKKELYAVVFFLGYWSSMISGCDVTVRTDHHSLTWLINFGKQKTGLQMYFRWVARLSECGKQLRIVHRAGESHANADALSRMRKAHARKPGERLNKCKFEGCEECKQEAEYNKQARGSDSEDSDEDDDWEESKELYCESNDPFDLPPPVHLIKMRRLCDMFNQLPDGDTALADEFIGAMQLRSGRRKEPPIVPSLPPRRSERLQSHRAGASQSPLENSKPLEPSSTAPADSTCEEGKVPTKVKTTEPATQGVPQLDKREPVKVGKDCTDRGVQAIPNDIREECRNRSLLNDELEHRDKKDVDMDVVKAICPQHSVQEWKEAQSKDPILSTLIQLRKDYPTGTELPEELRYEQLNEVKLYIRTIWTELEFDSNGILIWKEKVPIFVDHRGFRELRIVPLEYRLPIFHYVHQNELLHRGYEKMFYALRSRVWWCNMTVDVKDWSAACFDCQKSKPGSRGSKMPLKQRKTFDPMMRLSVDLVGPLPATNDNNKYMLVIVDYSSKYTEIFPIPRKEKEIVADKLYEEFMLRFGACDTLHSDKGTEFVNSILGILCNRWKIKRTTTSGYAPWSNGQVERCNGSIKMILRMFGEQYRYNWDTHIHKMRAAINNSKSASTGFTPFKVFFTFCRDATMPMDLMLLREKYKNVTFTCAAEYLVHQERVMCEILSMTRKHMLAQLKVQSRSVIKQGLLIREYKKGDLVLRKNVPVAIDTFGKEVWSGPYVVVDVNATSHNVRVWIPVAGRPTKDGEKLKELKWVHTANVKPCRRDLQGRLLTVRSASLEEDEVSGAFASILETNCVQREGVAPTAESKIPSGNVEFGRCTAIPVGDNVNVYVTLMVKDGVEMECMIYNCVQDVPDDLYQPVQERSLKDVTTFINNDKFKGVLNPGRRGPALSSEMLTLFSGLDDGSIVLSIRNPERIFKRERVIRRS